LKSGVGEGLKKKTSWSDSVRNEEVLHRVKEKRRLTGLFTSDEGTAF